MNMMGTNPWALANICAPTTIIPNPSPTWINPNENFKGVDGSNFLLLNQIHNAENGFG